MVHAQVEPVTYAGLRCTPDSQACRITAAVVGVAYGLTKSAYLHTFRVRICSAHTVGGRRGPFRRSWLGRCS